MPPPKSASDNAAKKRRQPRKISPGYLERAGLYYLGRYATSAENFRQVLWRKVWRAARVHETDEAQCAGWIEALVERYVAAGLIDDRSYADARARSLHRRGNGLRVIRGKLAQKGIAGDVIEAALEALAGEEAAASPGALDLRAALTLAAKRRLGPWRRDPLTRADNRARDMAALARAGFGYDIARRIVEAESAEAAEALIHE